MPRPWPKPRPSRATDAGPRSDSAALLGAAGAPVDTNVAVRRRQRALSIRPRVVREFKTGGGSALRLWVMTEIQQAPDPTSAESGAVEVPERPALEGLEEKWAERW